MNFVAWLSISSDSEKEAEEVEEVSEAVPDAKVILSAVIPFILTSIWSLAPSTSVKASSPAPKPVPRL